MVSPGSESFADIESVDINPLPGQDKILK